MTRSNAVRRRLRLHSRKCGPGPGGQRVPLQPSTDRDYIRGGGSDYADRVECPLDCGDLVGELIRGQGAE